MSFFLPSMTSYFGRKPLSTSTARSFLGRSLMCPSDAFTTNCLPKYLLIVFAFAGDSTITSAFAISPLVPLQDPPDGVLKPVRLIQNRLPFVFSLPRTTNPSVCALFQTALLLQPAASQA